MIDDQEVCMPRVVIDAMGGDLGLAVNIEGVAQLSLEDDNIQMVLVGDVGQVTGALSEHRHNPRKIQVRHAGPAVAMADDLSAGLDPNCSIAVAMAALAGGQGEALVSAGHTGATILAASKHLERFPGIRRAALAAVHPTERRHGPKGDPFALLLDVGATLSATTEDLIGFAVMGAAYAQVISDNPSPTVALLSNGIEASKGTKAIRAAHQALLDHPGVNFTGNVEGLDLPRGTADVVVTDGFVGNVVLKMLEGVTEVAADLAKDAYERKFLWRLGLTMLGGDLRQLRGLTDWKEYGGAPLLGFEAVIIKAHGRSNARAVRNAIKVAAKAVERDLSGKIRLGLSMIE
jgi:glycerol-3-phosphate acyltransferase PlsX